MILRYEQGFEQVCVRIQSRKDVPFLIRVFTRVFYRLANLLSFGQLPENVSDFRLASRPCYEAARQMRESNRFIRGQFAWIGFKTCFLNLDRPSRVAGKSKFLEFPKWNSIWLAVGAIFSHTSIPLLLVAGLGLILSLVSFTLTFVFAISWLLFGVPFAGYGTIVGLILSGFSLILLSLGVIALYLAATYEESKRRPLYVFAETTNLS